MSLQSSRFAFAWNWGTEEETSKMFNIFLEHIGGTDPASFQVICLNDLSIEQDVVSINIFLYDMHIVDGAMIGDFAKRGIGKHSNTVRLSLYNSHICCFSDNNALFKAYRCPLCEQLIGKTANLKKGT